MSGLSQEQVEKRAAIQKGAMIWGVVAGAVVGLLALWLLGGQNAAVRFGGTIVVAVGVGYLVFQASFKSGAKSARCEKCGATFSRSRTDHAETVISSTEKTEREEQADKSTKVTTWIEDKLDVVDTYACAKCDDVTTSKSQTTRRRDEKSVVEPFEMPKKTAAKTGTGAAVETQSGKSGAAKPGSSRGGKSRG